MPTVLYGQIGSTGSIPIAVSTKTGSNIGNALGFGVISDLQLTLQNPLISPVLASPAVPEPEPLNPIIYQRVGEYQNATFVSSDRQLSIQQKINNAKYVSSDYADIYTPNGFGYNDIELINIPNSLAQFNLRFTDSVARSVSSCRVYISDAISTGTFTSNFNMQWYECIHVSDSVSVAGSGLISWTPVTAGSTGCIILRSSPGIYGTNPTGSSSSSARHDWYFCASFTPAKTFYQSAMNISCMIEYV